MTSNAQYHVVTITNGTKFSIWNRKAEYIGMDGDLMFGDFERVADGQPIRFETAADAQHIVDRLNAA